ncbi:cyclic nucleotide-binding domain-containing protein [Pontibacter diazotrophicus]|uniref:Cyclic nucleotide-binding domain-containing protein n=1 Tax=Pontibacter diazotrophicus TaxID=1400979 RepID=A0A3D8LH17_9BACT|nr:cyclic nucleotide-binding domain-containing protein [Pontibacter diazotrophicus]RDV16730.1 cyclic nucleotide-binding domain-containing protein [Pontibacter diazotrophicus]
MLLIEKVLILRSSETFRNTPEQELIGLAGILEEVYLEADENLFRKGDRGNCMYFIYKGRVRIHDGSHTLAILDKNEIVGELSVLDSEKRSASATTEEETVLLKLEQEPFYEVLMDNAEILKGILKTLCRRLRIMDDKSVTHHKSNLTSLPSL